jgi:hypothetical protein
MLKQISVQLERLGHEHWYYVSGERHARFLKGMTLQKTGHFKQSYPLFKQLVQEDPDHHYYRAWYHHAKLGLFNWVSNGCLIFGSIVIFFDLLFSLDKKWPFDPGRVGLIIIGVTFLTQWIVRRYFKEKK